MANYTLRLATPTRGDSPFVYMPFQAGLTGADAQYFSIPQRFYLKDGQQFIYDLVAMYVFYEASADAANRLMSVQIRHRPAAGTALTVASWGADTAITANQDGVFMIGQFGFYDGVTPGASADVQAYVTIKPHMAMLNNRQDINFNASGGHANDTYTGLAVFKFLNYELGIHSSWWLPE